MPTPSPATALASEAAASFSETSPGSSRAATISLIPARSSATISASPMTVPFFTTRSFARTECAAVAPLASRGGTGPNFMAAPRRRGEAAA